MKILLTTSRKTSQRVRQFIKEFTNLFPSSYVQRSNRGKKSLPDLFNESINRYDRILIVTSKNGNPNKMLGYTKKDSEFLWSFELKLQSVKLSYEFGTDPLSIPIKTNLHFIDFAIELEQIFSSFFEPFIDPELNPSLETARDVFFRHIDKGFLLYAGDAEQQQNTIEILIKEIIIEDPDLN